MSAPAAVPIQDPPTSVWKILGKVGPGLIISANIVGSGELIATTKLGADVGFTLLWFIIFSCFIKVFVQVEMGRYAISEGISSIDAMNSLPGPRLLVSWCVWLWAAMYVGTIFQMSGMLGTIGQVLDLGFGREPASWTHTLWVILAAAGVAAPLVAGRYRMVEWLSTTMVVAFTLTTLAAVVMLQWTGWALTPAHLAEGLSFRLPPDIGIAFAVLGVTGVGAAELIFYPIWCLEKGYAASVGPRDDSAAWKARAKAWMRVMRVDAWVAMAIYTTATVAFYLLGAAILNGSGTGVTNDTLVTDLSGMYTETFGPFGLYVFLVGAFMVLFSTLFVSTASNARLFADGGRAFGIFHFPTSAHRRRVINIATIGIPSLISLVYLVTGRPVTLVLIGAFAQALMLPFLAGAAVYFMRKRVHPDLRPGAAWTALVWVSFVTLCSVGAYQAYLQVAG
jgi:Mn2+/Fe2+ NRAMP family transporter